MMKRYLDKRFITSEALELYVVNELSRARDRAGKTADRAFQMIILVSSWHQLEQEVPL